MRKIQLMATIMIALVLSIPIVLAQELNIQKFQGKDNARGYARSEDELTIEVLVKIPGETIIDKEQVRLYVEDSFAFFDSCVADGTYHKCTFYEPEFEAYEPIDFTIELRDDDGNIVGSETKTLVVDNTAPEIKELTVDPPISSGVVTLSYMAEDYAITYGQTDTCSGIKEIKITAGGQTITENEEPGVCQKDNTREITINDAGEQQICVTAKDHVNFASPPVCKEVTIDKTPPTIESLEIRDDNNVRVTHVHQGEEVLGNVNVVISDDGEVYIDSVFANFAQLNPNLPDDIPPDTINDELYTWTAIPVSEVSPCEITIAASDTLGNTAIEKFPCDIKADDTPPTFIKVVPEATRDTTPLYGFATMLTLELEDKDNDGGAGIGFEQKNVFLDLSPLGMPANSPADDCRQESSSTWHCSWLLIPPQATPENTYTLTLTTETSDDLGNYLENSQQFDIIYDNIGPEPPVIIKTEVVTGEEGTTYEGGAVKGDYMRYVVRSGNFVTAYANFSGIGGEEETNYISCEDTDNEILQDCTFEQLVDLSGPYTTEVNFDFYDDALNKKSASTTLEVYGISDEVNATYWKKPTITCSPKLIDRTTAKIFPPYVSCKIELTTSRKDIEPLAVAAPTDLSQCTGDTGFFSDLYVTNNYQGSTTPFLFFIMYPQDLSDVDSTNINCPITIRTKIKKDEGAYVSRNPQQLDVNVTLEYYSYEREIHKGVEDKIEEALDNGFANQHWIGDLNKILFYVQQACYLKNILANIIALVSSLVAIIGFAGGALETNPFTASAGKAVSANAGGLCDVDINLGEGYNTVKGFLDQLCAIANCQADGGGGFGEGYLAGGVPWCKDVSEWFSTFGGEFPEWERIQAGMSGGQKGPMTTGVKDSLILSIACLCLPGIIYNVEKMRQIECFKAVCYHDYVKEEGYPLDMCQSEYHYLWCTYVIGEIFALFPFAAFLDQMIDAIVSIIANPLIAIGMVFELFICETGCQAMKVGNTGGGATAAFVACAVYKVFGAVMETIAAIKKITDSENKFFKPGGAQYCDRMEDIADDYEED